MIFFDRPKKIIFFFNIKNQIIFIAVKYLHEVYFCGQMFLATNGNLSTICSSNIFF